VLIVKGLGESLRAKAVQARIIPKMPGSSHSDLQLQRFLHCQFSQSSALARSFRAAGVPAPDTNDNALIEPSEQSTGRIVSYSVNSPPSASVYPHGGVFARMARSGDRGDLLTAGLGLGPVREQVVSKISEDATWVAAAQHGDREAFGQLYERYARMVHGVLLAKVPVSDVDDLVQDVFIRALRRLSTLREKGSFGAWLAVIARNVARDYHRRRVPEEPLTDDPPDRGIQRAVSSDDHVGPAAAVLDAVRSLPDAYRETLILRLVEGMTGPEIASRTGLTPGSVRVNLHRGMEQLRAKLSGDPRRDGPEQEKP
jgi:RNA polymerase sigma-70 factor (ECF subfamily)